MIINAVNLDDSLNVITRLSFGIQENTHIEEPLSEEEIYKAYV